MGEFLQRLGFKLTFWTILSSLFLGLAVTRPAAHEVTPTIADLTVTDGAVALDLRLNIEAFLSGIDLDGLGDTDEADQSGRYDALRNLGPADLAARFETFFPGWNLRLATGPGDPVPLNIAGLEIPGIGDADLPRASQLHLSGKLPPGTRELALAWPGGAGALVLRQQGVDEPYTGYIEGGGSSGPIPLGGGTVRTGWQVFASYIPVGFDHILPKGLDHILFVLGLFFFSTHLRPLLWQISAFTVAHTVSLALGALGWVQVPAAIVEPLIAATIVFVAVENLFGGRLNPWRPIVVFCFGLLHGLGFASVLGEFGLPQGQFLPALIGFNIGVELGQLTVIAGAFLTVGYWFGDKPWYRARIAIPASVVIAAIGAFWFVQRVFG